MTDMYGRLTISLLGLILMNMTAVLESDATQTKPDKTEKIILR